MTITFPSTHNADAWKPVVIAALTSLGPLGHEVRFQSVLSWCESQPGFPGWGTWGTMTKRGKPYPRGQRAVTLAAGKLKAEGAITCPRRGYYALSGPVEAPVAAPVAPEAPMPDEAPTEPAKRPKARPRRLNVVTKEGVSFSPQASAVNSVGYEAADAGLRRMAAEQTRCFGAWSSRSDQCRSCPLAGLCQQAGMADFAEVAAALDAKTEMALVSATTPEVEDTVEVPVTPSGVTVPFACPCHSCGKTIAAGATAHYRPAEDGGGVFHPECFAQ
ncbi:MAG: hypothetical protein CMJ67_10815 [Planctomycetaceae bacterium]|nr:hypothetical protein [Planctomycetaceae bacterium]